LKHNTDDQRGAADRLSEQHPREQGLKPMRAVFGRIYFNILSEQHPREQGLKHRPYLDIRIYRGYRLSEQHPREQGLKPRGSTRGITSVSTFQSNIQENKD